MGKKRSRPTQRKRTPVDVLMAILGIGFIAIVVLVAILLLTHGCAVVHYPLDLESQL
jgi:hypothetical protein